MGDTCHPCAAAVGGGIVTRQLTTTAAEWASIRTEGDPATFSATGGRMVRTLWLVARGNEHWLMAPDEPKLISATPPVEFVQACAPCETCGDQRIATSGGPGYFKGGRLHHLAGGQTVMEIRCPDCCIELVSPCLLCGGSGRTLGGPLGEDVGDCRCAMTEGLIVFGHAYAVGSPLPIIRGWARPDGDSSGDVLSVWKGHYGPDVVMQRAWNATAIQTQYADRTAALAHAGPVEWLVGKWAIELRVVGS